MYSFNALAANETLVPRGPLFRIGDIKPIRFIEAGKADGAVWVSWSVASAAASISWWKNTQAQVSGRRPAQQGYAFRRKDRRRSIEHLLERPRLSADERLKLVENLWHPAAATNCSASSIPNEARVSSWLAGRRAVSRVKRNRGLMNGS